MQCGCTKSWHSGILKGNIQWLKFFKIMRKTMNIIWMHGCCRSSSYWEERQCLRPSPCQHWSENCSLADGRSSGKSTQNILALLSNPCCEWAKAVNNLHGGSEWTVKISAPIAAVITYHVQFVAFALYCTPLLYMFEKLCGEPLIKSTCSEAWSW